MRIHVNDMRSFEIDQRRRDVGFASAVAGAHHILNALVEQFCCHDHSISFARLLPVLGACCAEEPP